MKKLLPWTMLLKIILVMTICSPMAKAIDELNYQYNYKKIIWPFIQSMSEGNFQGQNNIRIHYRALENNAATVCLVILPGRTEPVEKYGEVVYDLLHSPIGNNLSFYLMDHRGQGTSGRMTKNPEVGHADKFENYILDLEHFLMLTVNKANCTKKYLLAHSLGAGIATGFVLKHPDYFDKVALSSPMLKIQTKPYPYPVARAIVDSAVLFGQAGKFAVGQKGFNPNLPFENNDFTSCPERFWMAMEMFRLMPSAELGGVSSGFVREVMKATNKMRRHYEDIKRPLRVYMAGIERYSETNEMMKLCQLAQDCRHLMLPTAKHEVLMDRDSNRNLVMSDLVTFFQ